MDMSVFDPPKKVRRNYKDITLRQTWGLSYEKVRVHPPVDVPTTHMADAPVFVFVPYTEHAITWAQKQIKRGQNYPSTFIAWDEDAQEYAIHRPGSDSITKPPAREGSEPVPERPNPTRVVKDLPRRKRRRFMDWWTSLGGANEIPDFLRKDN